MDFATLIRERYSVRSYLPKQVEVEKLNTILEAGRFAPTAANLQPITVLVAEEKDSLTKLSKAANIYDAPLALIVCANKEVAWTRPFDGMQTTDIDASIVTDHMMLQAAALGLGSVWICYFKPDVVKNEFAIPDNLEPVNILAIGYADKSSTPTKNRKGMNEFAFFTEGE